MNRSTENFSKCRSCGYFTEYFSQDQILGSDAIYTKCPSCSGVQVEDPKWLAMAHSKAISILDTGLVTRCISASRVTATLLSLERKSGTKGIDWGGGTGLFTRLMRDMGFDVYNYDMFSEPEHALGFQISDSNLEEAACFLTAFECFEHLVNPIHEFKAATANKDLFIFTTELIPTPPPDPKLKEWWYYMPETGQHVTFLSKSGLLKFRNLLDFKYGYSFGAVHVFSRYKLKTRTKVVLGNSLLRPFFLLLVSEILWRFSSLSQTDQEYLYKKSL
jgi:hypothetical protein